MITPSSPAAQPFKLSVKTQFLNETFTGLFILIHWGCETDCEYDINKTNMVSIYLQKVYVYNFLIH